MTSKGSFDDEQTNAELITSILQRRLSVLGISSSPINVIDQSADVVFHVRGAPAANDSQEIINHNDNIVRVLAHSAILRRESDYFREILQREPISVDDDGSKSSGRDDNPMHKIEDLNVDEISNYGDQINDDIDGADSIASANDIIGREVLARYVQAHITEGRRSTQYEDCKPPIETYTDTDDLCQEIQHNIIDPHTTLCSINAISEVPATISTANPSPAISTTATAQPRKSILVDSEERKASICTRKSVRFTLQPADIIPSTTNTDQAVIGNQAQEAAKCTMVDQLNEERFSSPTKGIIFTSDKDTNPSTSRVQHINKRMIKRRHTEVNLVMEKKEEKDSACFQFFIVKKLTWTAPVLIGILEWLYLGICHINLVDLPAVYDAAYRAVITGLTWCIRRHSMPDYLNLALTNATYCQSLLELCVIADCRELTELKCFCEALQTINGHPKIAVLETQNLPGRERDFLSEGFFVLDGHPLCVLKTCNAKESESSRDEEQFYDREPLPFLTFGRHLQQSSSSSSMIQQKISSNCKRRQQTWRVVMLDDDQAGSFHAFFNYAAICSFRSISNRKRKNIKSLAGGQEAFKLQMITRFKVGSILVQSLSKAIGDGMSVREKRGSGSFIKGPSYCTSIVLKGDPCKILMAAKAIPYDMVGRSALKIAAPYQRTFSNLFHASHTFGVDLHSRSVVLVKPLYVLIKVLEFMTKLNRDAYEVPGAERTFIELNESTEPF